MSILKNTWLKSIFESDKDLTNLINSKYNTRYVAENLVIESYVYDGTGSITLGPDEYGIPIYINGKNGTLAIDGLIQDCAISNSNPPIFQDIQFGVECYYLLVKYV